MQAFQMRPSIIFFDEIDGLAPVRSSRQDQIHSSIVSTLLALMDGLDSRGEIVVIGATNRIDSIDPALRRPGRFDREFLFPLPSRSVCNNLWWLISSCKLSVSQGCKFIQIRENQTWLQPIQYDLYETNWFSCVAATKIIARIDSVILIEFATLHMSENVTIQCISCCFLLIFTDVDKVEMTKKIEEIITLVQWDLWRRKEGGIGRRKREEREGEEERGTKWGYGGRWGEEVQS